MSKRLMIAALGAAFLFTGSMAHARKDDAGAPKAGPQSPQHMSEKGQLNTNNPLMGQDKGAARSGERKSETGLLHDQAGGKKAKGKKAKASKGKGKNK